MSFDEKTTSEIGYAKINLALDVTGKLPNGYHLVKMIMESISLSDELSISVNENPGVRLTIDMQNGSSPDLEPLSAGSDNLIVKAANVLLEKANKMDTGLDIHLIKRIPMAAGMAGGSTDAAATLRAVNRLLNCGLSIEELCEIGVGLGADIPFCIKGGSYLSEGIGEILTQIPAPPKAYLAIVKPQIDVSTKYVYEHLDSEGVEIHPDVDGMLKALDTGDLKGICDRLGNVLRNVTVVKYPIVKELEDTLKDNGALGALMSGSGPTVFGIFDDELACKKALEAVRVQFPDVYAESAEFV